MPLHTVTIIAGSETPVGDGITGAVRCLVRYPDLAVRRAVVKRLPARGVAAEMFCALLLRSWGLNVPEPAIVLEAPLAFASIDVGYPNLKQHIGWSETLPVAVRQVLEARGARLIASWADTPRAISADEAIGNRDRNFGNVLWNGVEVAWIDHERALGLSPDVDINKLVNIVLMTGEDHKPVQAAAVAIALTLAKAAVDESENECSTMDVAVLAEYVANRLPTLATRVLRRFPQPADLLNP